MPVGGAPPVNPDEMVGALLANPLVATLKVDHTFGKIPEHTERYKIQQPPVSQPELGGLSLTWCGVVWWPPWRHRAFTAILYTLQVDLTNGTLQVARHWQLRYSNALTCNNWSSNVHYSSFLSGALT